jgi:xanthine dehydrogenase accessory factor
MLCGGSATLFFEYFASKKHVYIFGAGHIGSALVYHLSKLNYHITVIDDREDVLDKIEYADEKIHANFETALKSRTVPAGAFYIIATYQHKYDGIVLNMIYESHPDAAYIGMVSSRKKKAQLLGELQKSVPNADLSICHIPVGLDIGGTLPHEIAISIIAEMQAVANQRSGKHLREDQ